MFARLCQDVLPVTDRCFVCCKASATINRVCMCGMLCTAHNDAAHECTVRADTRHDQVLVVEGKVFATMFISQDD